MKVSILKVSKYPRYLGYLSVFLAAALFSVPALALIAPEIDVTKTGQVIAKVGDEIIYTIGFTNTGSGLLGVCTGEDTLLGPLGVFLPGLPRDFLYIVRVGDPNPLPNTATITCDVEGFDNQASDFAIFI